MKQLIVFTCLWTFTVSLSYSDKESPMELMLSATTPWELKTAEGNLTVHFRFLKNENNEKSRQLKCSAKSDINKDMLWKVLKDPEISSKWLARLEFCEIFDGENKNEWYTYLLFDFPWPMSKRDILIKNTLVESSERTIIKMETERNRIQKKEGVVRMKGFFGYLKISDNNKTLEYSTFSNVKPKIPTWITDPFMEQSLINSFSKLRSILEENPDA